MSSDQKYTQNYAQNYAKASLILFLIIVVGLILLSPQAIARAGLDTTKYSNDFTVFYIAAENLVKRGDPYHHALALHTPYLYPPLFAVLLAPLTCFSLPWAATIWYWLNGTAALILIFASFHKSFIKEDLTHREQFLAQLMLCLISSRIIIDNLLWGQVNILVVLLIWGWYWGEINGYGRTAALLLAIAISIKITPALIVIYIFFQAKAAFKRVIIALIGLNMLSLLPLGWNAFYLINGWFQRTILNGQGFNWAYAGNQSLRGAFLRLFTTSPTESFWYPFANICALPVGLVSIMATIIGLALLIWALISFGNSSGNSSKRLSASWHWHWQDSSNQITLTQVAIISSLMLLLSNLSWKAHFIILILPWIVMIKEALDGNRVYYVLLIVSAILCNLTGAAIVGAQINQYSEVYSGYCLTALIAFFSLQIGYYRKMALAIVRQCSKDKA